MCALPPTKERLGLMWPCESRVLFSFFFSSSPLLRASFFFPRLEHLMKGLRRNLSCFPPFSSLFSSLGRLSRDRKKKIQCHPERLSVFPLLFLFSFPSPFTGYPQDALLTRFYHGKGKLRIEVFLLSFFPFFSCPLGSLLPHWK